MALNHISKIDGCTNSKSVALYPAFSGIPSSFFGFAFIFLYINESCCFDCNTKICYTLESLMALLMVHNVLYIFFLYFSKREATVL